MRCFYADGWDAIRRQLARASTAAALYEVRIRRLPDAMARAEWQVPRQRMRRYCGRHASRNAYRVPVAARAPGLGLTHALQKRCQDRPFRVSYDLLDRLNHRSPSRLIQSFVTPATRSLPPVTILPFAPNSPNRLTASGRVARSSSSNDYIVSPSALAPRGEDLLSQNRQNIDLHTHSFVDRAGDGRRRGADRRLADVFGAQDTPYALGAST
jgi:hypothetical protein